jgi:hypothetical protein
MTAVRIEAFDLWRPGYGLASVTIRRAGTTILADIFTDEALTNAAANPQTLLERNEGGISYGKFAVPLYTSQAYELLIDSIDQTGIVRPGITTLIGEDGSEILITVDGGTQPIALEGHLARRIDVRDYGVFLPVGDTDASAATNTASLVAAVGTAGAAGGGRVEIPEGVYQLNALTLPSGVVLQGRDKIATVLQSTQAAEVFEIGGRGAGFSRLTLDGISKVATSVGVYSVGIDETVFDDVLIKRFATGLQQLGGSRALWRNFDIEDCTSGALLHGDLDTANSGDGGPFQNNEWLSGRVAFCSGVGVELKTNDAPNKANTLRNIVFESNTGTAVKVVGARQWSLPGCSWIDNTVNLDVDDGDPEDTTNTVIDGTISAGTMEDGTITLEGNLETLIFERMQITDVAITITTPRHNILARDCRESGVTLAGTPTAWIRNKSNDRGAASGITAGDAATKAWAITLEPGQRCYLEAKVVGRQRNGINTGFYHVAVSAGRPGASLAYDSQTANFTVGNILTGGTSGATARITADADSGTTGTLTLQDVVGSFIDNEIITDGAGGSATANGALSFSNAALAGTVTALRAAQETDAAWDATFVANGPEIELRVTGKAAMTVEWYVDVEVTAS